MERTRYQLGREVTMAGEETRSRNYMRPSSMHPQDKDFGL